MIVIAGENMVDLIPAGEGLLRPALGGGPANTAVAAATLGASVAFAARFGADAYGRRFRQRLDDAGVDLRYAVDLPNPSALALAVIDASGTASYDFWLDNAADFTATALPQLASGDIAHIGSLAAYWPPGADLLEEWVADSPAVVTLDLNLRPIVLAKQSDAIDRLNRLLRLADVVKASDEDLRLAFPGADPQSLACSWLEKPGPAMVLLTMGVRGAVGLTRKGDQVHVPAPRVTVANTIGAGDAAMGALLTRLAAAGLDGVTEDLDGTLRFAVAAAALACTRPGAYAPSLDEVSELMRTE